MRGRSAARSMTVACIVSLLAAPATAQPRLNSEDHQTPPSLWPSGYRLALQDDGPAAAERSAEPTPPERRPDWLWTSIIAGGAIVGSTLNSVLDGKNQSYHLRRRVVRAPYALQRRRQGVALRRLSDPLQGVHA